MTSASSEKTGYENHVPDRNLAMELVRVTEAAAIAASPWVGYGTRTRRTAPRWTRCARSWTPWPWTAPW